MTDTAGLRRHNLRQWIEKYYGGLQTRFAEAVALNTGELSALLKNKSFGEKKARKIEQAAKMPAMWLDRANPAAQTDHQERRTMSHISPIPEILADIKAGKMVIITDAEDRENEGDLLMAAQFVTPEAINFMIKHARGLVCLPMDGEMVEKLGLPMMTQKNGAQYGTNFTVSIEAAHGITTGISAADRALTIQTAVSPTAKPEDIVQPGHIFPLRAQKGGVLVRAGHTEAGVDLAQMNGLIPAAVICEIINDDGTMARMPELMKFAENAVLVKRVIVKGKSLDKTRQLQTVREILVNVSFWEKQIVFDDYFPPDNLCPRVGDIVPPLHQRFKMADKIIIRKVRPFGDVAVIEGRGMQDQINLFVCKLL